MRPKRRRAPARAKYRGKVARIPRPLTYKAKQVLVKLVYHQNFLCKPGLNGASGGGQQQNFCFRIQLNSPWIFPDGWNQYATAPGQTLSPNTIINPVPVSGSPITSATTCMPGLKDGYNQYAQFQKGAVLGCKVSLTATPLINDQNNQPGIFYAVRHSQITSGLSLVSTIDSVNKMPFRQMTKLQGATSTPLANANNIVGSKLIVKHSPKKFNSVYGSLKTNNELWFSTNGDGVAPIEGDFLTIGCVPTLNSRQQQVTDFGLQMRVEQTIQLVEPREALVAGDGNYALPIMPSFRRFITARNAHSAFRALGY